MGYCADTFNNAAQGLMTAAQMGMKTVPVCAAGGFASYGFDPTRG